MTAQLFPTEPVNLLPHDGEAILFSNFFSPVESDQFLQILREDIAWKQEPIWMFGKKIMQPRLTALYGDQDVTYSYSGITMMPVRWSEPLQKIKSRIEEVSNSRFSHVLLNYYRDGQDSMGWHRDNEASLGPEPIIASVSFGVSRIFQFRNYKSKTEKIQVELNHGSLLLMKGTCQQYWEHQIPKSKKIHSGRINLTFRLIRGSK